MKTGKQDLRCYANRNSLFMFALMVALLCPPAQAFSLTDFPSPAAPLTRTAIHLASASSEAEEPGASTNLSDEPYDPFAEAGELDIEEYDPWEPMNTKIFEFNRQVDRWILKPIATGYNLVVPDLLQEGIRNFFYNTRFVPRFVNNVLQGKFRGAGIEVGRFLINTTIGIAGFIDWASNMDLITPEEDLGQTLGFYGIKPGPYLIVPLYSPFTVRDLIGYVGDVFLNPLYWLALPIIEIEQIPSAVPHSSRLTTSLILLTTKVTEVVNDRSLNLEKFQGVEESVVDLYAAVRNAYLQKRARAIKE